ncbi:putative L-lactate dehydrogenase operon regulatory protein [bioreactor metagenome]|uniref:Putative L-lactate dehydrogenase operon regulatory protein n=1 Tax=bioreactor metagenome TaxID=1076179 RepID=A0A644XZT5_9ZZZZ
MAAENKSLSERIATELYNIVVLQKKFAPGDKLPNENDLSQQLGVSRTTLREAVRYLVAQGVLSVQRGRGTFISEDLSIFNKYDVGTLSHARLGDMYEIRLMFEPQCSMLACFRATEEELQNIFEQAQYVEKLVLEDGAWPDEDQKFHEMLAAASHNEFIIRMFPIINAAVNEAMEMTDNTEALKNIVIFDNRDICGFLRLRDGAGAKSAMSIHIRHVINALGLSAGEL